MLSYISPQNRRSLSQFTMPLDTSSFSLSLMQIQKGSCVAEIETGLRFSDAFPLRRSQILLASHRGKRPKEIAHNLGCATQTVRNAIHAFEQKAWHEREKEKKRCG